MCICFCSPNRGEFNCPFVLIEKFCRCPVMCWIGHQEKTYVKCVHQYSYLLIGSKLFRYQQKISLSLSLSLVQKIDDCVPNISRGFFAPFLSEWDSFCFCFWQWWWGVCVKSNKFRLTFLLAGWRIKTSKERTKVTYVPSIVTKYITLTLKPKEWTFDPLSCH